MSGTALLTTSRTPGTLWQQYRIYDDHLELDTMFGRWTIPFADFVDHVSLDVRNRPLRRILFTPDDPIEFVRVLDRALERWRSAS